MEPPPPYESVPSNGFSAAFRQMHVDTNVASLKRNIEGHLEELHAKKSKLEAELSMLQQVQEKVENKRSYLGRELLEWKMHLVSQIEACYAKQKAQFESKIDEEQGKLRRLRQSIDDKIYACDYLRQRGSSALEAGAAEELQDTRDILHTKLKSLSTDGVAGNVMAVAETWKFEKPSPSEGMLSELLGQVVMEDDIPTEAAAKPSPVETGGYVEPNAPEEVEISDPYKLLYSFQTKTYKDKARCHPLSFAVTPSSDIIVPDKYNKKIKVFTNSGQLNYEITDPALQAPAVATITPSGFIAVSDQEGKDVKFFSYDGRLCAHLPMFESPVGIAVNSKGLVLVCDTYSRAVYVVDAHAGKIVQTISHYEMMQLAPGNVHPQKTLVPYFLWPHYVSVNDKDDIIVSDRAGDYIQIFSSDGKFIQRYGSTGKNYGQLQDPYATTTDTDGNIIVADYSNNRIQKVLLQTGCFETPLLTREDGVQFPTCVSETDDGKLIVSEYLSNQIKVFGTRAHQQDQEPRPPAYQDIYVAPSGIEGGSDRHAERPSAPPEQKVGQDWEVAL